MSGVSRRRVVYTGVRDPACVLERSVMDNGHWVMLVIEWMVMRFSSRSELAPQATASDAHSEHEVPLSMAN